MTETRALQSVLDPENPEVVRYRAQAPELLATAEALDITTDADLEHAGELTRTASFAIKEIKRLFKPAKQALDEAKRQVSGLEAALLLKFERSDHTLRNKVSMYMQRRRLEAEAETKRLREEERKRREDEQVAQAAQMERMAVATGDTQYKAMAERVLDAPIRESVVTVAAPKAKGIIPREETGVDVRDLKLLAHAVSDGEVSTQAIQANVAWLRNEAKQRGTTVKDGDELFPGVYVTKTPDITVRSR